MDRWHAPPTPAGKKYQPAPDKAKDDVHSYEVNNRNLVDAAVVASELCYRLSALHVQKVAIAVYVRAGMRQWDDACCECTRYLVSQMSRDNFEVLSQIVTTPKLMEKIIPFLSSLVETTHRQQIYDSIIDKADAKALIAKTCSLLIEATERTRNMHLIIVFCSLHPIIKGVHALELIACIHKMVSTPDMFARLGHMHREEIVRLFSIFGNVGVAMHEPQSGMAPSWGGQLPPSSNVRRILHALSLTASQPSFLATLEEREMLHLVHGMTLMQYIIPSLLRSMCEHLAHTQAYKGYSPGNLCEFLYRVLSTRCLHPVFIRDTLGPMLDLFADASYHKSLSVLQMGLLSKAITVAKLRNSTTVASLCEHYTTLLDAGGKELENPTALLLVLRCIESLKLMGNVGGHVELFCKSWVHNEAVLQRMHASHPGFRYEDIANSLSYGFVGREMPFYARLFCFKLLDLALQRDLKQDNTLDSSVMILSICSRLKTFEKSVLLSYSAETDTDKNSLNLNLEYFNGVVSEGVQRSIGIIASTVEAASNGCERSIRHLTERAFCSYLWGLGQQGTNLKVKGGNPYTYEAVFALKYLTMESSKALLSSVHPTHAWWIIHSLTCVTEELQHLASTDPNKADSLNKFTAYICKVVMDHSMQKHILKEFDSVSVRKLIRALMKISMVDVDNEDGALYVDLLISRVMGDTQLVKAMTTDHALRFMEMLALFISHHQVRDKRTTEAEIINLFLIVLRPNMEYLEPVQKVLIVKLFGDLRIKPLPPTVSTALSAMGSDILSTEARRTHSTEPSHTATLTVISRTLVISSLLKLGLAKPQSITQLCQSAIDQRTPLDAKGLKWYLYGLAQTTVLSDTVRTLVDGICALGLMPVDGASDASLPCVQFRLLGGGSCTQKDLVMFLWAMCRLQHFPKDLLHLIVHELLQQEPKDTTILRGVRSNNLVTILTGLTVAETIPYTFLDPFFERFLMRVVESDSLALLDYPRLRAVIGNLMERTNIEASAFYREARKVLVKQKEVENEARSAVAA